MIFTNLYADSFKVQVENASEPVENVRGKIQLRFPYREWTARDSYYLKRRSSIYLTIYFVANPEKLRHL